MGTGTSHLQQVGQMEEGGRRQTSTKGPTEHHQGARKITFGGNCGILGLDLVYRDTNSFKQRTTDGITDQKTDGTIEIAGPGPPCLLRPFPQREGWSVLLLVLPGAPFGATVLSVSL